MLDRSTSRTTSRPHRVRALAVAVLAAGVLASGLAAPPAEAVTALPPSERIAGPDRNQTARTLSERVFPSGADIVYLVNGETFADGLSAGAAAAHEGGPVLLTPRASLAPATELELTRLDPSTVVLVGGTPSLSAEVEAAVEAAVDPTADVVRVAGADRFETSRLVAERAFASAVSAFVATGLRFPDALSAGPAAAERSGPVLLVDGGRASLDAATAATLESLGVAWVGVVGGEDAVSSGIFEDLDAGLDVRRFAGPDRFGTAVALLDVFDAVDTVYIVSGEGFADALAGAAAAGAQGAAMLLARQACMPGSTLDALLELQPDRVILLGGVPTLSLGTGWYERCP